MKKFKTINLTLAIILILQVILPVFTNIEVSRVDAADDSSTGIQPIRTYNASNKLDMSRATNTTPVHPTLDTEGLPSTAIYRADGKDNVKYNNNYIEFTKGGSTLIMKIDFNKVGAIGVNFEAKAAGADGVAMGTMTQETYNTFTTYTNDANWDESDKDNKFSANQKRNNFLGEKDTNGEYKYYIKGINFATTYFKNTLKLTEETGEEYFFIGAWGDGGQTAAKVYVEAIYIYPKLEVTNPVSVTQNIGETATFTIGTNGNKCQWYKSYIKDGKYTEFTPISGATDRSYSSVVGENDQGARYFCRVSDTLYDNTDNNGNSDLSGTLFFSNSNEKDTDYLDSGIATLTIPEHRVTYYANDGDPNNNKKGFSFYGGKEHTIKDNMFSKEGYTFIGWNTKEDGSGATYKKDSIYYGGTTNGNGTHSLSGGESYDYKFSTLNLYAQWRKANYTLTINPNGGTYTEEAEPTVNVGESITIQNPTRDGFSFNGWIKTGAEDSTIITNRNTDGTIKDTKFTMGSGNTILTANWIKNKYNLTVKPNGGIWEGKSSVQKIEEIEYESTETISNPSRNGYSFKNWILLGNGSSLNGTTFTMGYEDASLEADWKLITKDITGSVTWSDQNNKYYTRPDNVTVTLGRRPTTGAVTPLPDPITISGNSNFSFNGVQSFDTTTGEAYNYTVQQDTVTGYKTTVNGFNITNTLIVPTYSSNITVTPKDTYQDRYLKNGRVLINANVTNTSGTTYENLGLHNGIVTFNIDTGIALDTNTLKVFHTNKDGVKTQVNSYTLNNNTLTIDFGTGKESRAGEKIEVEVYGTLNEIKQYNLDINLTGKLKDYDGKNTEIDLGTLTNKSKNFNVEYQMPKANISIIKQDSITEERLTGATFTLYEWNGAEYVQKEIIQDTNLDGIYESNYYEWNTTTKGKYKIVETTTPNNHKDLGFSMEFVINQLKTSNYTITPDYNNPNYKINYNVRTPDDFDNINGIVENEPYKIKASIDLLDSQTLKQIQNEATFKIYEWDKTTNNYKPYISYITGQEVTIRRQADKTYLSSEWLYYTDNNEGKYRIVEEQAPTGYYGDYNEEGNLRTYDINVLELVGTNGTTNEMTIRLANQEGHFVNKRTKAEIKINKIDSETKKGAQGDATLKGAVYELYAKNNIYHVDGITTNYEGERALLYKKDQVVATMSTNEQGQIIFGGLECGEYYIKEKTPSSGYLLDTKTYYVSVTHQNQQIDLMAQEITVEEKVAKQGIQLYKIKQTDRTEYEGLQNAGFTIYRINSLSIVKEGKITKNEDGTYTLNDEKAKKDEAITKLANKNGTYNISDLINYYYKIKYTEQEASKLPQDENNYYPYNINEEKVKDYSSSIEGNEIEELISTGDGYIRSPELAYGEYIMIETSVPKNLEPATPFYIEVKQDSRKPQQLKFIVDSNFETKIKVYNIDSETGKNIINNNSKYVIYDEEGNLMTAKAWDATNGYVEYGTLEHPFITGKDGYLITPMKLPVGNYTLVEIEAPNGYVINGQEGYSSNGQTIKQPEQQVKFQISTTGIYYTDDYLDTTIVVINQKNKAQVGTLELTTKGEYVKEAIKNNDGNYDFTYETKQVTGAVYEVRAKENILTSDGQGTIIYSKDQLVQTITSNNEGKAYAENLPQGKYYITQITPGEGFRLTNEQKEIEITYGTNDKAIEQGTSKWKESAEETPVVYIQEEYQNQKQEIKITIDKKEPETNEKIPGAQIGLYVQEPIKNKTTNQTILEKDTLVNSQITNEEGKITIQNNLPLGKYYVKEIKAPTGYIYSEETKEIDGSYDTSAIQTKEINVEIINQRTSINIVKQDTEGNNLEGAILEIRNSKDEVIETWTTTNTPKNIKSLKIDEQYKLVETKPTQGYVTAESINFQVTEEGQIQIQGQTEQTNTIIMKDPATKIMVELLDTKTKEQVSGAVLKILNEQEQVVATWTTNTKPKNIEKLPIGKYKLVEETVPQDQGYVKVQEIEFEIRDTMEVQRITMLQERTKVEIHLLDKETNQEVIRATMQIIKKDETGEEHVVEEWVNQTGGHTVEKLPTGKYIIRETRTPTDRGYVTIEDIDIEIHDTLKTQIYNITSDITKLQINLIDEETKEQIPGATLQIINKQTGEIIREFTTEETAYETKRLAVGEYILKQKIALTEEGQATGGEIEFRVEDTNQMQTVTMVQGHTKLEIELVDKQTKERLPGIKLEIYKVVTGENGEKQKGEKVREFTTSEENYKTEKLPVGKYLIHEVEGQVEQLQNKGYVTKEDIEIEIRDTTKNQKAIIEQDYTKLEVEVVDSQTQEKLPGIKVQIYEVKEKEGTNEQGEKELQKEKGQLVKEYITGIQNYETIKLPVGEYLIHEEEGQKGVLLNNGYITKEDTYFKIEDTKEIQKVTIEQERTKIEIEIIDNETLELIEGIKLEIYEVITGPNGEKQKGQLIKEIETTKDTIIEKLPVGEYLVQQAEGQVELLNKGYVTNQATYIKVEDTKGEQKITIEQTKSRLEIELVDKETKEKIEGSKLEIYKLDENGKEELEREIETTKENTIVEKLPTGVYILRQKEDGIKEKGYIRIKDITFGIQDTIKTQKMIVQQDYTKIEVKVVDTETKEEVLGSRLTITDKDGNEKTDEWISTKEGKQIIRLPVGEYYIEEKEAPTLRGYVKAEKQSIKVAEKEETQKYELEQDYTKVEIELVDEITKEKIKEAEITIKDERGNEIGKLTLKENEAEANKQEETDEQEVETKEKEQEEQILERLPVGKYSIESTSIQYGYKEVKGKIEIIETKEKQKHIIKVERENFDIEVTETIKEIKRNEETIYKNEKEEQSVRKVDVKDKNIPTEDIRITYKIKVKNIGKITGEVGKIEVTIPQGMKYVAEDNKGYWKAEDGKVITTGLAGRKLKAGAYAEIEITLRWRNGLENFGTKSNTVKIQEVTSDIGFKETNEENNVTKSADVIIGVSTGEMNILWTCWLLILILILIEIYITKKLHIRRFKIKDKTLKYRDQNNK